MSYLPEISQEQRGTNIKKLINQNKKLHGEIFVFEEQINKIVSSFSQEQKAKLQQTQVRRSSSRQKRSQSNFGSHTLPLKQNAQNPQQKNASTLIFNQEAIQKLLDSNSPLIETKIIPGLKEHLEYLKSLNIKENMHYILKEEDELKIIKKELNKLRREKQVVADYVKDKTMKLEKQNNELTIHKNTLRKDLADTVKLNRHSASVIIQIEREIRKFHLMLHEYKRLLQHPLSQGREKSNIQKITSDPSGYLSQIQNQSLRLRQQMLGVEAKWKQQLDALDKQYYQLKEELSKKELEQRAVRQNEVFHKTRILVMKDEQKILSEKEKKSLVKTSPRLQKQLEQYLKQEQEKLRKKEQYIRKHRPRNKDQEQYQKIVITSAAKSPNPENTLVQTSHDDKNIVKLKSYLRPKQKVDKQTQAQINTTENHRLQRSWTQTHDEQALQAKYSQLNLNKKDKDKNQKAMPRILLKNIKLGTTFHNQTQEDNH